MIVSATDTDIIVPAIDDHQKIPATEIWFPFGVWKNFNYISAHQIVSQRGPHPASMLPMFQTITGCDTVSFLAGKGKGRTWKVWQTYPETKPVFPSLFSGPGVLDESFCSHKDASLCFCRTRPAE